MEGIRWKITEDEFGFFLDIYAEKGKRKNIATIAFRAGDDYAAINVMPMPNPRVVKTHVGNQEVHVQPAFHQ